MKGTFVFKVDFVLFLIALVDFGRYVISSTESTSTVIPKTRFSQNTQQDDPESVIKANLVWILSGSAALLLVLALGGYLIHRYRKRNERRSKRDAERYVVEVLQQLENENQVVQFLHMLEVSSRETLEKEGLSYKQDGSFTGDLESSDAKVSIVDRINDQIPPTYDELFTEAVSTNFGTYNNDGFTGDDSPQSTEPITALNGDPDNVFLACSGTESGDGKARGGTAGENTELVTKEICSSQLRRKKQDQQQHHMRRQQRQQKEQQEKLSGLELSDIVICDDWIDEASFSRLSMDLNKIFAEEDVIAWYSDETREKYIRALSTSGDEEEAESLDQEICHGNTTQTQ